ncbi:MAG: hypothetical protein AAF514_22605, partial [Verrucomicrobiota bacterium]
MVVRLLLPLVLSIQTLSAQYEFETIPEMNLKAKKKLVAYLNNKLDRLAPEVPTEENKQIFESYKINEKSTWARNWTKDLDFSGVAWDKPQCGTLISRQHIVFATHYPRAKGPICFHDRNGQPVKRNLIATAPIGRGAFPDVTVGLLDEPVPKSVTHYKILPAGFDYTALYGAKVIVTSNKRKVLLFEAYNTKDSPVPPHYGKFGSRQGFTTPIDRSWQENLVAGDSGHPTFLLVDGKLILLSTTTGGGLGGSGPFFGSLPIQK